MILFVKFDVFANALYFRCKKHKMAVDQRRVILWAVPRSISTACFRAMMNKSKTRVTLVYKYIFILHGT